MADNNLMIQFTNSSYFIIAILSTYAIIFAGLIFGMNIFAVIGICVAVFCLIFAIYALQIMRITEQMAGTKCLSGVVWRAGAKPSYCQIYIAHHEPLDCNGEDKIIEIPEVKAELEKLMQPERAQVGDFISPDPNGKLIENMLGELEKAAEKKEEEREKEIAEMNQMLKEGYTRLQKSYQEFRQAVDENGGSSRVYDLRLRIKTPEYKTKMYYYWIEVGEGSVVMNDAFMKNVKNLVLVLNRPIEEAIVTYQEFADYGEQFQIRAAVSLVELCFWGIVGEKIPVFYALFTARDAEEPIRKVEEAIGSRMQEIASNVVIKQYESFKAHNHQINAWRVRSELNRREKEDIEQQLSMRKTKPLRTKHGYEPTNDRKQVRLAIWIMGGFALVAIVFAIALIGGVFG